MGKHDDFFDEGDETKFYMSYLKAKDECQISIIPSTYSYACDKFNNSRHNITFKGEMIKGVLNTIGYQNQKGIVVFPRKSFKSMLIKFGLTRQQIETFLDCEFNKRITFKRHNDKNYELLEIVSVIGD